VHETTAGLTASLTLAGKPCMAFGQDIKSLTIAVSYESKTRYAPYAFPLLFLLLTTRAGCT
jgi:alpha-glucosidase